jgi:hypothetical protein
MGFNLTQKEEMEEGEEILCCRIKSSKKEGGGREGRSRIIT